MKTGMKYGRYLILCISLLCFSATASAIMALPGSGAGTAKIQKTEKAGQGPVKFIAWKGNRLSTTAGTFIVNPSVLVVDKADTKKMRGDFKGSAPSVKLFFKDRRLVKVIIK